LLVLHADNFGENKNNDLFLFLTELIYRKWFSEIRIEFGLPGHTHNGNDGVHGIHNHVAGNFDSFTLGEFQRSWKNAWRKANTIPTAVVLDCQV
jgi:hypothetical protein